ncbi:MAG TPA: hypothetical protein VNZ86_15460 [Bacteroidia bacterium]|jgi:hypothetical protein|nr:hypothetical protein [Bacteroidia bacterium]
MKPCKLILFLTGLLLCFQIQAQIPDTSGLPAKWKKESVIILNYEMKIDEYLKGEVNMVYLIRDKWGVEELSRFTVPAEISSIDDAIIGKVYKRNGDSILISKDHLLSNHAKLLMKHSGFLNGDDESLGEKESQKLAIPSLDIGDVLQIKFNCKMNKRPTYVLAANSFPMLSFHYTVSTSYSSGGSLYAIIRNCPDSLLTTTGTYFSVRREMVDKYDSELLDGDEIHAPCVFITYKGSSRTLTDLEMQEALVHTVFDANDKPEKKLARLIYNALQLKYKDRHHTDTLAYVSDAFYMYREIMNRTLVMGIPSEIMFSNSGVFTNVMARVLMKKRIRHKVFYSQPDYFGDPYPTQHFFNLETGIVLPFHSFYLFNPYHTPDPNVIPKDFEGQGYYVSTANGYFNKCKYLAGWWLIYPPAYVVLLPITTPIYLIKKAKYDRYKRYDLKSGTFPVTDPTDNQIQNVWSIQNLSPDHTDIRISGEARYTGKYKVNEDNSLWTLFKKDHLTRNSYSSLLPLEYNAVKPNRKEDSLAQANQQEYLKYSMDNDGLHVDKVDSFRLQPSGSFDAAKPLVTSYSCTIQNMVWKYDHFLIVSAGKLIGDQLSIPDTTGGRMRDFHIPYKKQICNTFSISIPEHYTVQNMTDFNVKIEKEAGLFQSEAKLDGNILKITTTKIYKFKDYPASGAKEVYAFIDLAQKFREKKLILREQ